MVENENLVARIGFDKAENGPKPIGPTLVVASARSAIRGCFDSCRCDINGELRADAFGLAASSDIADV